MPRISSINENNAFVKLQESANGRHCIGMLFKGEILLTNQGKRKRIILMDEMKESFEESVIMLRKFGQVILDYFLINYPETGSFRLSVDDYTFSEFAIMANVDEAKVINLIQSKKTSFSNALEALAIAAYQVKLVGDVESVQSTGSDSYYQKIKDNYSPYKFSNDTSICTGYFSNQINLWREVHSLFKNHGRNLVIPDDHPGPGRYVQYPVNSHEMKNSDLLRWADKFLKKELVPQDITVSYSYFCSLFFPNFRNESYKRTIYNFYKIWDGRSFHDILNRCQRSTAIRDLNTSGSKIVLDYLTTKVTFFNQETAEKITSLSVLKSLLYSQSNIVFFIQNEENEFYSAKKNKIEFGLDFIIVSTNELNINDDYLANRIQQKFGNETLYIYVIQFSKDACEKLHIATAKKPPFDLVGGLKKSRNCYYRFGLPVIEFSEPQTFMYINSTRVPIKSNRVVLSLLPCLESIIKNGGSVDIRLADYLPVHFTVEGFDSERKQPDEIGWEFNDVRYVPSSIKEGDETDCGAIIGFNSTIEFVPVKDEIVNNDTRRNFVVRNEYLENRFIEREVSRKWLKNI